MTSSVSGAGTDSYAVLTGQEVKRSPEFPRALMTGVDIIANSGQEKRAATEPGGRHILRDLPALGPTAGALNREPTPEPAQTALAVKGTPVPKDSYKTNRNEQLFPKLTLEV